jgi:DNA topoisomerase-1
MTKNLLIVESPAKAKTIEKYLGEEFTVRSSIGHIRDLPEKGIGIDIANNFTPDYEVSADKKKVVAELKKLAKQSDMVWLATDEDREGEAIAWHLAKEMDLDEKQANRVVYHEITKSAIQEALKHPRPIDQNLVNAQQARRILDRLVGYELSPVLWRKVKPSLSAGRVQSVTVRLIVEREREINNFVSVSFFKVDGLFNVALQPPIGGAGGNFHAELDKKYAKEEQAHEFLTKINGAEYFVRDLEKKPGKRSPSAPFTTSTLQQEASRKLGFSVLQTMRVAQGLYERGNITYMRTDSVNLSQQAIDGAKEEIEKNFGAKYVFTRQYKTKSSSAQEAHEAIRPTDFSAKEIEGHNDNEARLYDLIRKRTIASQMANAEVEKTVITIGQNKTQDNFIATGEVITFDGFLRVYSESDDEDEAGTNQESSEAATLPMVEVNQKVNFMEANAVQRFPNSPPRYTEASLVKKLEALGIGRPSTYAPTISTVQNRGYVVKESKEGTPRAYKVITLKNGEIKTTTKTENTGAEKSKLFPTDIGNVVTDFLIDNFGEILDYNFTANVEEEFDIIAEGKLSWTAMLKKFYAPFHTTVEKATAVKERASGEKLLGQDSTGKNVYVKIGRYGPMVQLGDFKEEVEGVEPKPEDKPKYSKLRPDQRMETITLQEALDLFKMPRKIGFYEEKEMTIGIGRFGPYIRHDSKFYSLSKEDDPYTVTDERAVEVILAKRKMEAERTIKIIPHDPEIQILKGRYGPYLASGGNNYKIPKNMEPADLKLDDCLKIMNDKDALMKKRGGFSRGGNKGKFKKSK